MRCCKHLIESRAFCFGASDSNRVFVKDLKASLVGKSAQIQQLRLRILIECRYAHVEGSSLHLVTLIP